MKVRVLFFAILREKLRKDEGEFEISEGETVLDLACRILSPVFDQAVFFRSLLYAVNNEYVSRDYRLKAGDELVLIPPVAGG